MEISLLLNAWFPRVIASAPARMNSSAIAAVMPSPPALFSPLMMVKSGLCLALNAGRCSLTASLPGRPTTSPRNKML